MYNVINIGKKHNLIYIILFSNNYFLYTITYLCVVYTCFHSVNGIRFINFLYHIYAVTTDKQYHVRI